MALRIPVPPVCAAVRAHHGEDPYVIARWRRMLVWVWVVWFAPRHERGMLAWDTGRKTVRTGS